MAEKNFSFGFVLSAALNSKFSSSFAKASRNIEQLSEHMEKMQAQAARLKGAFDAGIINDKTFKSAVAIQGQRAMRAYGEAAKGAFNEAAVNAGILYYKTRALASAMAEPVRAAMQFESSMADVKKVVDFDTPQQFKEMSRDILELSKRIPMTAEALAQIVASGGQSGIVKQDLTAFAESAAKMGVAFDITAEEAGDMMAKWRTAFKMGQNDVNVLADKINYLGNTTAASAPLISDVVTRIGPLGEVGGVASGEIAALGASMIGAGIQSEVAATGLKNMILTLVSGEGATKTQAAAFESLGMNSVELAQRMQTDAKGAILDVLTAIQNLDEASRASTLQKLFGKESLGAIAPLLSNLDGLKDNFNKVAKAENYAGSMQAEFAARADTTENSVQLMNNRIDAAKIAIGNGLLPVITPTVEIIGKMVSFVGDLAMKYPGLTTAVIGTVGAIAAFSAIVQVGRILQLEYNAALFTYNALIKSGLAKTVIMAAVSKASAVGMGIMTAAQWAVNSALLACPITWIIGGIVALGAAGYALYKNWDVVKEFFITLWNDPMAAIQSFIDGIYAKFGEAFAWLLDKWSNVKQFFSAPITATVNAVKNGMGIAQNAAGGIYGKGAFLTTFAESSGESAIPHTPNARNIGLLAETNRIMGNPLGGGNVSINYNPTINVSGGNVSAERIAEVSLRKLKQMLREIQADGRRVSFA
jgi:TP901 family phage tail tape measure protein